MYDIRLWLVQPHIRICSLSSPTQCLQHTLVEDYSSHFGFPLQLLLHHAAYLWCERPILTNVDLNPQDNQVTTTINWKSPFDERANAVYHHPQPPIWRYQNARVAYDWIIETTKHVMIKNVLEDWNKKNHTLKKNMQRGGKP